MLSEEQVKQVKEQLLKQTENFPEEQKQEAKKQIEAMNSQELEEFLVKNKLIKNQEIEHGTAREERQECPFCLIIQEKVPAFKIASNKQSLAVLEINPLSKGHIIIIPKKHQAVEKISSQAFSLAKEVSKKIKFKLNPKEISMQPSTTFGHGIIGVIPLYENAKLERKKASEQELKALQEVLVSKPKVKIIKEKTAKSKELEKAPVRIP